MNTFRVLNDEGKQVECDILFTFDNEDTGKSYIVYTDNSRDLVGNIQVYASIYDPSQESPQLLPIETEEEWGTIENILNSIQAAQRGGTQREE